MNQTRTFLVVALVFVAWLIWNQWQQDYGARPSSANETAAAVAQADAEGNPASSGEVPGSTPQSRESPPHAASPLTQVTANSNAPIPTTPRQLVTLSNDVLRLTIDSRGGSIVRADLLKYPQQVAGDSSPVRLLDDSDARLFVAQDGLVGSSGSAAPDHFAPFEPQRASSGLAADAGSVSLDLTWHSVGVDVVKRYTLARGSYVVQLEQRIDNHGAQAWSGNAYEQIERVQPPAPPKRFLEFYDPERSSFIGAAWYSPQDKFNKLAFDKFESDMLNREVQSGWVAMIQHYFFAAWIPSATQGQQFVTAQLPAGGESSKPRYIIRSQGPNVSVAPGGSAILQAKLYVGPKTQSTLSTVAPGLELTIDYGIFTVIAQPLFWILSKFHALVGNWGVAIILLVLLIKAVFFKLSEQQYKAGAKMRKLQPRIAALKERYGEDKQKQQQAMMELYQKEKVNPLAGCLPTLIQIPVFFALYYVLMYSVELRHAPFFGWIHDLSAPDPWFVLPVLYTLVMIATQYLTPVQGMDPTQAKIMKAMPIVFAGMFAFFPAGLTLYYVINGLTGVIQQWVITRRIERADARAKA